MSKRHPWPLWTLVVAFALLAAGVPFVFPSRHHREEEPATASPYVDDPEIMLLLPWDLESEHAPDLAYFPRRVQDAIAASVEARELLKREQVVILLRRRPEDPWRIAGSRPWKGHPRAANDLQP